MAITEAQLDELEWTDIRPNEQGDWINQRSEDYLNLRPVAVIQSENAMPSLTPLFKQSSLGVITNRDSWVYNSSREKLRDQVERQVAFYNEQIKGLKSGAASVAREARRFKWDGTAEQRAKRGLLAETQSSRFRSAIYRPYFRQQFYMDRVLNNSVYQIPKYFPTPDIRNPSIVVERGLPAPGRTIAILAIDTAPDAKAARAHLAWLARLSRATRMKRLPIHPGIDVGGGTEPKRQHHQRSSRHLPRTLWRVGDEGPHLLLRLRHTTLAGLPRALRRRSRQTVAAHPRSRNGGCLPRVL